MAAAHLQKLDVLDEARRMTTPGARLVAVRRAIPRLRDAIGGSGKPDVVRTYSLATFPYPTQFALAGTPRWPWPFVMITNRMQIVQWVSGGTKQTLLVNPTDLLRSGQAPFFAKQIERYGMFVTQKILATLHGDVSTALGQAGVKPEEVDYITFDHLHVQDVRGLLGTLDGTERALLPNAVLLAQAEELELFSCLHPLQAPWYVKDGIRGVDPRKLVALSSDVLVGPGVALVRTPGHTAGNHSIVLHTDSGLWTISENGVAVDSYAPGSSEIKGLRSYARSSEVEVILNANTREGSLEQYTSMILEKELADLCRQRPEFPQHFPSSEMTADLRAPGLAPTYCHGEIVHGAFRASLGARAA